MRNVGPNAVTIWRSGYWEARRGVWRASRTACLGLLGGLLAPVGIAGQMPESVDPFAGPRIHLDRRVVIRSAVAGGPELTAPRTILADTRHIDVLDPAAFGVHRFDRAGVWLRTIGRRGDGPGEFQRPIAMGRIADTLWVADRALNRLSFIDRDGTFVRSVSFGIIQGPTLTGPRRALADSRIASVPYIGTTSAGSVDSLPVLIHADDGAVRDTLAWQAVGQVAVTVTTPPHNGERMPRTMSIKHPFDQRSLIAYDPLGRWVDIGTWRLGADEVHRLRMVRTAAVGDTVAVIELPFESTPATSDEVRAFARRIHPGLPPAFRARVSAASLAQAFLEQIPRPSEPSVDAMVVAEDGVLWFHKTNRSPNSEGERWIAYRPGKGFWGWIGLSVGEYLATATGGLLWTVSQDELDLPTITGWAPRVEDTGR